MGVLETVKMVNSKGHCVVVATANQRDYAAKGYIVVKPDPEPVDTAPAGGGPIDVPPTTDHGETTEPAPSTMEDATPDVAAGGDDDV